MKNYQITKRTHRDNVKMDQMIISVLEMSKFCCGGRQSVSQSVSVTCASS